MKRIGTVAAYHDGRRLGVYYRAHGVATRLEQQADGWSISVCNEGHALWARQELEAFVRDPGDPRFPSLSMPEHILAAMRPDDRQAIEMHHSGYSPEQIAAKVGILERRVRRLLVWFRERLYQEYGI
jgi:hypothetical protein